MTDPVSIALIGCGKMGSALLRGWIGANLINDTHVFDPNGIPEEFLHKETVSYVQKISDIPFNDCDITILAVKPQTMKDVCGDILSCLPSSHPVLSIAAGTSLSQFAYHLSVTTPVIRTMPNTPAAIGKGMVALCANAQVSDKQKDTATTLMQAIGETIWLEKEDMMDAITAISGSGPAYLFYMIEALQKGAIQLGFDNQTAELLARQTIIGAAALADHEHKTPASTLRQNVTSPGGTTEAALKVLMDGRFQEIINEAVQAAETRGKELSEG